LFALLKRYRELILVAVLLLVPLGVFFAHAKAPSERSKLDRAVVWLATPVERAIGWTLTGVMNAWNGYVALRGAHAQAGRLADEVRLLELERQQLLVERAEAQRLR
jgi:rod shape-determining protein MreC